MIINAVEALITENRLDPDAVHIWVDYCSIPQRNAVLKELSIASLGMYASNCGKY